MENSDTTASETVAVFKPYPFYVGKRIFIEAGPRRGDWEVIDVNDRKVTLRCPISKREFQWNRFCYLVAETAEGPWPHPD